MTEFYSGDDLSSLPLTKEELALVEIVRDDDERDWNRIVRERKSAFLAAELFSERRNAVSWFELGRDCRVLEIGSGYGALTGALADRAGTVVSFEDSEIRGAINRFRQRRHKNVAVYSGDFKDIIELADVRKFDVITLMGEGADVSRLAEYAGLLKQDGRVILALPNRYGLKYWAGCSCADKNGGLCYFPFASTSSALPSFGATRAEILRAANAAGFAHAKLYYPYPDHQFVRAIYSDDFLPDRGTLTLNSFSWSGERMRLFEESSAYDRLLADGAYPFFANAFFVVLEREGMDSSGARMIHTRFSSSRARRFQVQTEICLGVDGRRIVRKFPMFPEGIAHIETACKNGAFLRERFMKAGVNVASGAWKDGFAEIPYLSGMSLGDRLAELALSGDWAGFNGAFLAYCEKVRGMATGPFQPTNRFREIFGVAAVPTGLSACDQVDIDFIPQNILIVDHSWQVADMEWTFDFPVPVEFILYRAVFYFELDYPDVAREITAAGIDLLRLAGVEKLTQLFAAMEYWFQNEYVGIRDQNFTTLQFADILVPSRERLGFLKRCRRFIGVARDRIRG